MKKLEEMTDREIMIYGFKRIIEEQNATQAAINRVADLIEKGNRSAAQALELAVNKSMLPLTDTLLQLEARARSIDGTALATQNNVIRVYEQLKKGGRNDAQG